MAESEESEESEKLKNNKKIERIIVETDAYIYTTKSVTRWGSKKIKEGKKKRKRNRNKEEKKGQKKKSAYLFEYTPPTSMGNLLFTREATSLFISFIYLLSK